MMKHRLRYYYRAYGNVFGSKWNNFLDWLIFWLKYDYEFKTVFPVKENGLPYSWCQYKKLWERMATKEVC